MNADEISSLVMAALEECVKHLDDFDLKQIQWTRLYCVEVKPVSWSVLIEGAAPDCPALCASVQEYLESRGIVAVVKTEW